MFVLKKTEGNFRWQTSHRHLHGVERQPEGVQVVEGVGLVASGFQFFTRLGSVFAEEVDSLALNAGYLSYQPLLTSHLLGQPTETRLHLQIVVPLLPGHLHSNN